MNISSPIFNIFRASPIRPLQEHIDKAHAAVEALVPFFAAVYAENWSEAKKEQALIAKLEDQADDIKKDIRLHMPTGLFMPVERTDLLDLLSKQDKIANRAEDISGLVLGRQMKIPQKIADLYLTFLKRCIDASAQACKAIHELDELLEAGFRGSEVDLVKNMIQTLDDIEDETDDMQAEIRRELFEIEKTLSPIDVVFLYKVIEQTGKLADSANSVGSRLELLLAG